MALQSKIKPRKIVVMDTIKEAWKEFTLLVYWVFSYLDINVDFILALIVLMLVDTVVGIAKGFSFSKKITFRRLFSGLMTKVSILLLPFLLALVAKNLAPRYDFTPLVDIMLDIMLVSEFISILTNIISIKTKKEIKNFDIITRLLKAFRSYLVKFANVLLLKVQEPEDEKEESDK